MRSSCAKVWVAKLTNRRLKRGVFRSVADLEDAINRFVAETNADPKPLKLLELAMGFEPTTPTLAALGHV